MEEKTPLLQVVEALSDYYGEDRVDLQENIIYVYFPHVIVTNENNRSIDITELYVKIRVEDTGVMSGIFTLNRAEYTVLQWLSDYMHSHVSGIPKSHPTSFLSPCLGRGPIKDTCATLNSIFDIDIWKLFALELDKYVHTESISGVPYRYLEKIVPSDSVSECSISINSTAYDDSLISANTALKDKFFPYMIRKRPLSFSFDGTYGIADSPYNIVIKISNLFIEWYNSLPASEQGTIKTDMFNENHLLICKVNHGKIIHLKKTDIDYMSLKRLTGTVLWMFKNNIVKLNITGIPENDNNIILDDNCSVLLHPDIVMSMVNKMLKILNYRYGNQKSYGPDSKPVYL